jgi:hypothetical protein
MTVGQRDFETVGSDYSELELLLHPYGAPKLSCFISAIGVASLRDELTIKTPTPEVSGKLFNHDNPQVIWSAYSL